MTDTDTPALDTWGGSPQWTSLAAAFVAAWGELPDIARGEKAKIETKGGGSYTYAYADLGAALAAVRPILARHGLAVMQPVADAPDGTPVVTTLLVHNSGEWFRSTFAVRPADRTPQSVGSAITYARRYALLAMLGVATADDDGAAASRPAPSRPAPAPEPSEDEVARSAGWANRAEHDERWHPLRDATRSAAPEVQTAVRKLLGGIRPPFSPAILDDWAALLPAPTSTPLLNASAAATVNDAVAAAVVVAYDDVMGAAGPDDSLPDLLDSVRSLVVNATGTEDWIVTELVAEHHEAQTGSVETAEG